MATDLPLADGSRNSGSVCSRSGSRSRSPHREIDVTNVENRIDSCTVDGTSGEGRALHDHDADGEADMFLAAAAERASTTAVKDDHRTFKCGDQVLLRGLKSRADLNGRSATVVQTFDQDHVSSKLARYVVQMDESIEHSTAQFAVKNENLQERFVQPAADSIHTAGTVEPSSPILPTHHAARTMATKNDSTAACVAAAAAAADAAGDVDDAGNASTIGGIFGSNFQRLRKRAEAEARGELPARRSDVHVAGESKVCANNKTDKCAGGNNERSEKKRRRGEFDEDALHNPLTFVPAAEISVPSRRVVVIDPRRQGVSADDDSGDDSVDNEPGRIIPPVRQHWPPETEAWTVISSTKEADGGQTRGDSGSASVSSPRTTWTAPHAAPLPKVMPLPPGANLKLAVSESARAEDKSAKDVSLKRSALETGRRVMLEKLTKQMQTCLSRVQAGDLDDAAKEKYQDMIASVKAQMAKISARCV